jgi:cyclopropane fatty-acyl-phospholipid synthase-like methyltransferase
MASHNVCLSGRRGIEASEAPPGAERAGDSASCVKIATTCEARGRVSNEDLIAFYERKTQEILKRYGPGPRVHYHTGLVDQPPAIGASSEELRRELIVAQERTLEYAAQVWDAASTLCGDILDVGCGLGGGAIFWAQKFGANVTAVTIAPSHIPIVEGFAAQAGVASRVQAVCCDALAMPGQACFDAAVAIDSSNYFPRRPWFRRLERLLRPEGHVFIFDGFLGRSEYEEPFNRHWCSQIGTLEEYVAAAADAHFSVETIEDVSVRAVHFWTRTLALLHLEAQDARLSAPQRRKLEDSLLTHALVRQGLLDGGLRFLLMTFAKR